MSNLQYIIIPLEHSWREHSSNVTMRVVTFIELILCLINRKRILIEILNFCIPFGDGLVGSR